MLSPHSTAELEALYDLSSQLGAIRGEDELLRVVVECLQRVQSVDVAAGLLLTETLQAVVFKGRQALSLDTLSEVTGSMVSALQQLGSPAVQRASSCRAVLLSEPADNARLETGPQSVLQVPLTIEGEAVGALYMARPAAQAFGEGDVRFLYTLAGQASVVLHRLHAVMTDERRRLERVLRDLPDGVMLLDSDRKMVFANRVALQLLPMLGEAQTGHRVEHLAGVSLDELLQSTSDTTLEIEAGKETSTKINVSAVRSDGGSDLVVLLRDVTEERDQQQRSALQERLALVGQLAGGVAHDFNNLLNVVLGYCELLLHKLGPNTTLSADLLEIQKAGERATVLTRQLLAFSRRQLLVAKVLDLNTVMVDMDRLLRRLIGEDIKLTVSLQADLGRIKADPGQIEQVIMNLAINARDAMPRGGHLTLQTANVTLDETYARRHVAVRPGPYVMFSVADTGMGMDARTRSRIFEPFFTTKEQASGTGLGLATVYGIVKQSGGNIWVYSEPGHGTTFKIYLPRVDEAREPAPVPGIAPPIRRGTETILLVEDEVEVRRLVARLLESNGYAVVEASDGEEALEVYKTSQMPIDLVLTDVVMTVMSGREMAEHLRLHKPDIKILYMSGYTDDTIFRHGILNAGEPFLQKPFTAEALAAKVRQVLDGTPA